MDQSDFEGSLVLEKLAEVELLDAFYEAVDSDDFEGVARIVRKAGFHAESIHVVLKKMTDSSE